MKPADLSWQPARRARFVPVLRTLLLATAELAILLGILGVGLAYLVVGAAAVDGLPR